MKKIANWCKASVVAIGFLGLMHHASARDLVELEVFGEPTSPPTVDKTTTAMGSIAAMEAYAKKVYNQIDFNRNRKLSQSVFIKAYQGFLNLKQSGQLDSKRSIISICDFSLSSNVPRLWVIDLDKKKVLFNTLVAHGQGSGEEFATAFSNVEGTHQSSMGFFVTTNTYYGDKGYSLKLEGMDKGFNCQAFNRAIVIHAADYVSYDFIKSNQRLGRSWGCPALPTELNRPIIDVIKGGTALFIYTDSKKYLTASKWLKKYPHIDASEFNKSDPENTRLADASLNTLEELAKPSGPVPRKKIDPKDIPLEEYFN